MVNINTQEAWPVWIGWIGFCIILVLRSVTNFSLTDLKSWSDDASLVIQLTPELFITIFGILVYILAILFVCHKALRVKFSLLSYLTIFYMVLVARILGTFAQLKSSGISTSFWCIVLGCCSRLLLNDTLHNTMSMEFFIKVSIVLFATDIQNVISIGPKGLVVAWIETTLLLLIVYFIGIYIIRLSRTQSLLISTGLSICGSSAIMTLYDIITKNNTNTQNTQDIAEPQEISNTENTQQFDQQQYDQYDQQYIDQRQIEQQHDQEQQIEDQHNDQQAIEYDMYVSIMILSIFNIPLIPLMPYLATYYKFSPITTGLWIGGTMDSTGTVIASASLLGNSVLDSAVILKMLQNLLICPFALVLTAIWYRSINLATLWKNFPKFILGFIVVCITVSSLTPQLRTGVSNDCFIVSEWFSYISFFLIGMDINLYDLKTLANKWRMVVLYIIGQTIDGFTTFGFVYLLFGM